MIGGMAIRIESSGFDDFESDMLTVLKEALEEKHAQQVAKLMSERGISDANRVEITAETDSPEVTLDVDRIRELAQRYFDGTP